MVETMGMISGWALLVVLVVLGLVLAGAACASWPTWAWSTSGYALSTG